jgi:hypothetical protein
MAENLSIREIRKLRDKPCDQKEMLRLHCRKAE